jgi:glucose 1-dehydrogenase
MRAVAVLPSEKKLRLIDHPAPHIEHDTDVRVRVLEVGICGTDREVARFEYGQPPPGEKHLVIGHEMLGQVVEVGKKVSAVEPGDLVVTTVRRVCEDPGCLPCQYERPDFCRTGAFTERGINGRHGFMIDEIVDDERFMCRVPRQLSGVGVLTEPLTIATKALIELEQFLNRLPWLSEVGGERGVAPNRNALVLGAGPVGLLGALAIRLRGYNTFVYSREESTSPKAAWVKSIGARYLASGDVPANALAEQIGNIDLIYEATGSATLPFIVMTSLGVNGCFIFTGVPGGGKPITLDSQLIMRNLVLKNQILYGTVNAGPDAFAEAIAELGKYQARWPEAVKALLTAHCKPETIEEWVLGKQTGIKNVVQFGRLDA